jgi:hypothetical protein
MSPGLDLSSPKRSAAPPGKTSPCRGKPSKARLAATALLAVAAVYLAVWPHELGHASAAWLYGCKADPWRTGTLWYLTGSRPGASERFWRMAFVGFALLVAGAAVASRFLLT